MWSVEHGPKGGDELNLIEENPNYGWSVETAGLQYDVYVAGAPRDQPDGKVQVRPLMDPGQRLSDRFRLAALTFVPSIGISNVKVVTGFAPYWNGDLLISSLRDQAIHRVRLHDTMVVYSERIEIGERLTYLETRENSIYLLTDGRLIRLRMEASL